MDKDQFFKAYVTLIVAVPTFAPDPKDKIKAAIWYEHLKDIPFEKFNEAVSQAIKSLMQFPSIAWLRRAAGGSVLGPEAIGEDVQRKIVAAISKWGYTNSSRAEYDIGPLGWAVVGELGGWGRVCDVNDDGLPSFCKRVRDAAENMYLRFEASDQDASLASLQESPEKPTIGIASVYLAVAAQESKDIATPSVARKSFAEQVADLKAKNEAWEKERRQAEEARGAK